VTKAFGEFAAISDVSLVIPEGALVALLGPSGSGKTTLLRVIAGLEQAQAGRVRLAGIDVTDAPVQRRGIGFVFQDYALFEHMSVADNIAFGLAVQRESAHRIDARVRELLDLVQLRDVGARAPRELSGGQRQRVAIARALGSDPEALLADEPVSMLDVSIRLGVLNLLRDLKERFNLAILYITHDIASARYFADHTLVMYAGRMVEGGDSETVTQAPAHPYTRLLIGSAPDPDRLTGDLTDVQDQGNGEPPSLIHPPAGCRFHPRCPMAMARCTTDLPVQIEIGDGPGHWAACWLYDEETVRRQRPGSAVAALNGRGAAK
ncbi:MAG: peptide/nickel transport system ATP-binding protein, partial [Actinoplanes sp.]|nr:peptide/nickel transport system ATP-binding protein [Actinoplanes sp.]